VKEALLIAAGYVLGSLPWAYWLPRVFRGVDIRKVGSGNVGASNVWRTFGWKLGVPVLALDVAKGAAAALLGLLLADELTGVLAGAAAVAGHWRPLFLGFSRGGKVVATTGGVILALAPLAGLCAVAVWIVVFLLFRYASVASIVAGLSLAPFALLFGAPWPVLGFTIGAAVAILVLHRANLRRLMHGEEPRAQLRLPRGRVRRRSEASL
jgi:acyl phosphate:glycerol-3-phosphate acyltransferase